MGPLGNRGFYHVWVEKIVAYKECEKCKQALVVVQVNDQKLLREQATDQRHVCWTLPQDANLLVLED